MQDNQTEESLSDTLVQVLPVHVLKLRWLNSRRIFLPSQHIDTLEDIMREGFTLSCVTKTYTAEDNIQALDTIYKIARAHNKRFGV